jgi:hypothetical protein
VLPTHLGRTIPEQSVRLLACCAQVALLVHGSSDRFSQTDERAWADESGRYWASRRAASEDALVGGPELNEDGVDRRRLPEQRAEAGPGERLRLAVE